MLRHRLTDRKLGQGGVTLVELMVVIVLTLTLSVTFYTFYKTNLFSYLNLQKEASYFTDLAAQSQRIARVLRGATDITTAAANDMQLYGYFSPADTYVSQIRYYKNAAGTALLADVTRMTANPPIGTPIASSLQTYTIIDNFKQTAGVNLFNYLDSTGSVMPLPIADLHTIKGVRVNLAVVSAAANNNQSMTVEVSLRNRKTNL